MLGPESMDQRGIDGAIGGCVEEREEVVRGECARRERRDAVGDGDGGRSE